MSEYSERRTVVEDVPIKRARPVVETQYDSVVHENRGMSGGAVAALVLAAIAAAVVITLLIMNNQQRASDDELAQERARAAAAQQAANQQPSQQPVPAPQQPQVVVVPSTGTPSAPAPAPVVTPAPAEVAPSSAQVEIDVTTKLLDDSDLRSHPIDVKVTGRTAILTGQVPNDELKSRAAQLARSVKGVGRVINNIVVQP
jgi:osmotically-inducible protein OsmY